MFTVIYLTVIQWLPQLKVHINTALNVGKAPPEIREAIYTFFSFNSFSRTLNAIEIFNIIMKKKIFLFL